MPAYYNEANTSCALDRCLDRVRQMSDWDNKYPYKKSAAPKSEAWEWAWLCRAQE